MAANAEPIYWPESVEEPEDDEIAQKRQRIIHVRHRVGKYVVTRLVLDSRDVSDSTER